jgi:hypothetical protein
MAFHPSSDREKRLRGAEEGSIRIPPTGRGGHDFDAPAWRRPDTCAQARNFRDPAPRLINLERRAHFARLPFDLH